MAVELTAHGIDKRFGGIVAVDGMGISVEHGSITGLIGPNGAGKSTFFDCISGHQRADAGQVTFNGESIAGWPIHRVARRGLVRTFQLESALEGMTLRENLMLAGSQDEHVWFALSKRLRATEPDNRRNADDMLAFFGLDHLSDAYAGNLSGGQKKLLDLARALMLQPRMLLLDEPMAGVNPTLRKQIMQRIVELRDDRDLTVLLVEHDMHTVFGHCDHIVVMAEGKHLAEGDAASVRADPRVREAYLG